MGLGSTVLELAAHNYNSGHGVIFGAICVTCWHDWRPTLTLSRNISTLIYRSDVGTDAGTSVNYFAGPVYRALDLAFHSETASMGIGQATTVMGAECWPVRQVPGGIASFPALQVRFHIDFV